MRALSLARLTWLGVLLLVLNLYFGAWGQVPTWQWASSPGGGDGQAMTVDASGNVYVTGSFNGTVTFGNTTLASAGGEDIFVAKLSPSGSYIWAVRAGGANDDVSGSIALDVGGNVFISDYFRGTADFGPFIVTSNGAQDAFLAKLNSNGNWQWVQKIGGASDAFAIGLDTDPNGNVYITGGFLGSATFGSFSLTSAGYYDIFVAKASDAGTWQWAVKAGGSAADDYGSSLSIDPSGSIVIAGAFKGVSATFGAITLRHPSSSTSSHLFVAKLNASGTWQWAKAGDGTASDADFKLDINSNSDIYVTGAFWGSTATFGSYTLTNSGSFSDLFVAKLNAAGTWQWATSASGTSEERAKGIFVDSYGDPVITGDSDGPSTTFGVTSVTYAAPGGNMYVAKLSSGGVWQWAVKAERASGNAVAVNSSGGVFLTGYVQSIYGAVFGSNNIYGGLFVSYLSAAVPVISSFSPASGPVGAAVTFTGTNLTNATSVSFNGTPATNLSVNSATQITATVPVSATSGPISVTTPEGTATSFASFSVVPLTITGLLPARNLRSALPSSNVAVTFSQPMQNVTATQQAVRVFSQQRGGMMFGSNRGMVSVSGNTIAFDPANNFKPGETIYVTATTGATATSGGTLLRGQVHQFTASAASAMGQFLLPPVNPDPSISNGVMWSTATGVALGDLDGDGDLDLVATIFNGLITSGNTLTIRLNDGTGNFALTPTTSTYAGSQPQGLALGDIDGDGDLDAVVANSSSSGSTGPGAVSTMLNNGAGIFTRSGYVATAELPRAVALGDIDGDGDLDILTANNGADYGQTVSVRINDGTGTFTTPTTSNPEVLVGLAPFDIALGDLDNDGDLDFVAANNATNSASSPSCASVRLNNGNGVFSAPAANGTLTTGGNPSSVALGDLNGDGNLDAVIANFGSSTVSVKLNDGQGNLLTPATNASVSVGGRPMEVALGDVDGDGDLDLLTANNVGNTASIRLNDGTGTFVTPATTDPTVNSAQQGLAMGDADGDGDLDLVTVGGATASVRFNQNTQPPTINSFIPASGPAGTNVVLTGTGFLGVSALTFNGTVATNFTVNSATNISAIVPAGSTTGPISVTSPIGTAASTTSFTVIPSPALISFTPTSAKTGTTVTLTGTNLTGATSVKFGGVAATTFTVNSATSITVTVPAAALSGPISVTTPGGTATSASSFTVLPSISSFSPSAGATVGATVTLSGSGFTGATAISFNGVAAASFTVVSATTITMVVPAIAMTGPITVTTPAGAASSTSFKVLPTISGFTPAFGTPHAPATVVTITGSGFLGATAMKFGAGACPAGTFQVVNSTTITATVPALSTTGKISVTTAGGTASSVGTFGVAPTITGLLPAQGSPGSVVLLTGRNFTSPTTVTLNGTPCAAVYNATTQLTVTIPAGATSGTFTAATAYGTHTLATPYTVTTGAAPTITSFAPTQQVLRGTLVTITGTRFTGASLVRFNNVNATSFTVLSDTQVQAAVPTGATSGKVYVVTPTGMAQSAASLTIVQPPTLTSFSPASGSPGSVVLLTGANYSGTTFPGVTSVTLNGAAVPYVANSASSITVTLPAGATSGQFVVTTLAGTATSAGTFTVTSAPATTITSFTPATGPRGSTVVLTGTNFTGVTSVKVNTVAATTYSVDSPTQITLTVPSTVTTGRIYVTAAGGMAQTAGNYTVVLPPTIISFTPASGAVGALVTINGTNFTGATSVTFGTQSTSSFTLVSASRLTANVPAGATTGTIKVSNAAGTATSAASFTVTGARPAAVVSVLTDPLELTLYPNPAHDYLEVLIMNLPDETATAELLDPLGRVLRTVEVQEGVNHLELNQLRAGVYTLRVRGQHQRLVVE